MNNSFEPDSLEEKSHIREYGRNNSFIDWRKWVELTNIQPRQAALLLHHIDPDKHENNNDRYDELSDRHGKISDNEYSEIRSLTQWLESRASLWTLVDLVAMELYLGLGDFYYVPTGMISAVDEIKQAEAVVGVNTGSEKKKRKKGNADRLRTAHFIEWVDRTKYKGNQTNYHLQDELRADNIDLWGKNEQTFNKWLQTSEAIPAKAILDRLKLEARSAV